ncbi:hypothetical protein EPN87_02930 [archaeon]|nr:MAG: hypothetical protein EPN87_02930 [archaeon]
MDQLLKVLEASYGNTYWLNTFVSKGPLVVEFRNKEPWFIVDKKTLGYPFVKWVGRNILSGGNWRESDYGTADVTPMYMFKRQIREELKKNWPGELMLTVKPFADYIEISNVDDHGYEKMRETSPQTNGTVHAFVTVIGATIEGEELESALNKPHGELDPAYLLSKIRSADVGTGKEAGLSVYTMEDLKRGAINYFAAGDGIKLADYINETYGVKLSFTPTNGSSFRLSEFYPNKPYAERKDMLQYLRVNPLREPIKDHGSPFNKLTKTLLTIV